MCVFIYITYLLLMKDTSVVTLKSKNMECMHRKVVLKYVPSSLRSSCQAGGSKQHPEMIHSFLLSQTIPVSANYYINGIFFSMLSVCVFNIWTSVDTNRTIWLNFSPSVQKYVSKKMGPCRNIFDIGKQSHFLKVPFAAH